MFKYLEVKKCNYCGGSNLRKIISVSDEQNLVECLHCGLVFLNKQRADIENLYNGGYYLSLIHI